MHQKLLYDVGFKKVNTPREYKIEEFRKKDKTIYYSKLRKKFFVDKGCKFKRSFVPYNSVEEAICHTI